MTDSILQDEVLTAGGAAKLLKCSAAHIRNQAANGTIPGIRLGVKWIFSKQRLLELVRGDGETKETAQLPRKKARP